MATKDSGKNPATNKSACCILLIRLNQTEASWKSEGKGYFTL